MSLNLNNTNPFVLQILCFNMSSINSSLFYSKNEDVITPVWPGNNIDSEHESSSENEEEEIIPHLNVSNSTKSKRKKVLVADSESDTDTSECRWPKSNAEASNIVIPPSSDESHEKISKKKTRKKVITSVVNVDRFPSRKVPTVLAASMNQANASVRHTLQYSSNVRRRLLPRESNGQSWIPSQRASKLVNKAVENGNAKGLFTFKVVEFY